MLLLHLSNSGVTPGAGWLDSCWPDRQTPWLVHDIAYKGLIPDLQTSPSLQTVTGSFWSQQSQVTIILSTAGFQKGEKV